MESYFVGGGIGRLKVPDGEQAPGARFDSDLYNLEAGINWLAWRGLGVYAAVKYIDAEESVDGTKVIDFNGRVLLVGITYSFGL